MFKKIFLVVGFFCFFELSTFKIEAIGKKTANIDFIGKESLQENRPKYAPDEILIKFKKDKVNLVNVGLFSFFRELNTSYSNNLKKDDVLEAGNVVVYKINDGRSVEEVIEEVKKDANVESAQPNYYSYVSALGTNDTEKNKLWGLDNTGQTITKDNGEMITGVADADIDMPEAWAVSIGTSEVIVAIIDTGVNYNHPDLIDNMWDGSNCVDENGDTIVGGCLYGYNFVNNSTNPAPIVTSSHGTHIAGVIAGSVDNSLGIAGVGRQTKIMALNCEDADGYIDSVCVIKSIDFAIQNGAKVINASYAGSFFNSLEYDAINRFKTAGGIFVAAAGNENTNNETTHSYPSDYDLDNIISVAATDIGDSLADFSNFGTTSVDVGAPGVDILSTVTYRQDYYEDFLNLTADVGSSWLMDVSSAGAKYMWTDESVPYLDNMDYYITSATINLSGLTTVHTDFSFTTACDDLGTTAVGGAASGDYMALEVSGDGTSFTEISRWNEESIRVMSDSSCTATRCGNTFNVDIGESYLTSNFKYRLRWVTDGSLSTTEGCYIQNIKIIDYNSTTAGYDYMQGTSMAAPYVAGLAGYLLSVDPTATYSEIRSNILNNGDTLPSLEGKTVTGRRINAFNSITNLDLGATEPTPTPTPTLTITPTPTLTITPTPTPVEIGATDIGQLLDDGIFEIPVGNVETGTSKVVVTNEVVISVGESSTLATIILENQTEITREDTVPFDATLISATIMDKSEVSNLASGFNATNLMQWGIPGVTLTFSNPVFIDMYVGSAYNGQTLSILRSPSTSSGWTNQGLVNDTCVISGGFCTFSTNTASYFTVVYYQAPSNNQSSSSNSSSSGGSGFVCNDEAPTKVPDLFELRSTKGTAKLFYTPSSRATTYAVLYGFKKGDERFGAIVGTTNDNKGVQNADILALNPKSTYYFKVAAINGCNIGPWSEWVPIRADRKKTVFRYKTIIKKGIKQLVDQFLK